MKRLMIPFALIFAFYGCAKRATVPPPEGVEEVSILEEEELVEEIVALSKRYGIITPYTSFLVTEDEPPPEAFAGLRQEWGAAAVKASEHLRDYARASTEGEASAEGVRYIAGKAFFFRDGFWVDTEVEEGEPAQEVEFGSEEYFSLLSGHPGMGKFLALGRNIVLRYDGTVYRIAERTGVGEGPPLPDDFRLFPNFPNPFNASTLIPFRIPEDSHVLLEIYDIKGRRVRVLSDGFVGVGEHVLLWDGKDARGLDSSSGVYLYMLRAYRDGKERFRDVGKMVLVR